MLQSRAIRVSAAFASLALFTAACGTDEPVATNTETTTPSETTSESMAPVDSATICDADSLVAAVQGGASEGTLEGMADDPVATAASNNPVLTTLVAAVTAADLGGTLNGAEALTVFAPTDCAFANLDPATLQAALDDPSGLLTTVLGFHVLTERLDFDAIKGSETFTTFTGEELTVSVDGDVVTLNGSTIIQVPNIQTNNATVYLIDSVMLPPSVTNG